MKNPESHIAIEHEGKVIKVDDRSVVVGISSNSACSGCHAEGLCNLSGKEEKSVYITGNYNVSPGDNVIIVMEKASGYKAVILSYVVPLILILTCLVTLESLSVNELISGLISISILLPYFLILYLFKKKINQNFNFTLKT